MNTSRISSGFDVELQLGAAWFRTAIKLMNDNGLLAPPGLPVIISDLCIVFEPDWDLAISILGLTEPVFVKVALNDAGNELSLTTNMAVIPPTTIPLALIDNLSGSPVLTKKRGDTEHEDVMILLANMKIHAEPQNERPRNLDTNPLSRGDADAAQSFLLKGHDIAFGISSAALSRFANNLWHTELRAENGSHPLPNEENKQGEWRRVHMFASGGKIKIVLEGEVPIDSPIIDVVPDAQVKITLTLTPVLENGTLTFSIDPETDVDTGLLGDLFGAIAGALGGGVLGGIIGFIVGLVTGGILGAVLAGIAIGAGIGLAAGIIAIEIIEVVVEGKVQREIKAKINGERLPNILCSESGLVQIATPNHEGGFDLSVLDSIPTSIAIHTDNPADEFLYKKSLLVTSNYDEFTADTGGFALAGRSGTDVKFQPERVAVRRFNYQGETLESVTYVRLHDNREQTLALADVLARSSEGELQAPFRLFVKPDGASLRIPEGQLACVTLQPLGIRQEKTVVQEIEFANGLRLRVPDAVRLQDSAAIYIMGYQLIHPRDYNAYYRAKADDSLDNNFEALPKFGVQG